MKYTAGLILLTCNLIYGCRHENLVAVVVTFRHGHRNVLETYPTDPYKGPEYWPEGPGQLTNEGKNDHYRLGKWFREYYKCFLPKYYDASFYRIQSTDVDRTLMSAYSHLAGLLPPQGREIWNKNFTNWQPIPVHTRPLDTDIILGDVKTCLKYERDYADLETSAEFQQRFYEGQPAYIQQNSGKQIDQFFDLLEMFDILYVEEFDKGLKLPKWTKQVYTQPLQRLMELAFAMPCYTDALTRLKLGPFLHEVITYFKLLRDSNVPSHKYRIYSAHDLNVANLQMAFGEYKMVRPPYASSLIMELRRNLKTKTYYVNVLLKNETDVNRLPHKLRVKGCKFDCDLDQFVKLLDPVTVSPEQWEKECKEIGGGGGGGIHALALDNSKAYALYSGGRKSRID